MRASIKRKKEQARQRRKTRIRKRILGSDAVPRVSIYRSARYTYLQAISDESSKTLVSICSRDPKVLALAKELEVEREGASRSTKSVASARAVGRMLGEQLLSQKVERVVFDRNGFLYAGRVAAAAEGLREAGVTV